MKVPEHVSVAAKRLLRGESSVREYLEEIEGFQCDVGDGRLLLAVGIQAGRGPSAIESRLLGLVAEGFTDEQIAKKLGIEKETVKTHLRMLYLWLGARNRAHAVAVGMRRGFV